MTKSSGAKCLHRVPYDEASRKAGCGSAWKTISPRWYGDLSNSIRASIDAADEAGDADTADIFTAFSRSLDKALWFLEAHKAVKA